MKRMNRNLLVTMTVVAMTILTHGHGQQGGRGGAPGGRGTGTPAADANRAKTGHSECQGAGHAARNTSRSERSCDTMTTVVRVSTGGKVQRQWQHRRGVELCLQHRILI